MITLIDRSRTRLAEGMLSESTLDAIEASALAGGVLVYLNRRGAFRAFVCEDCSYQWKCPHCDVALTLHAASERKLLCHHCGYSCPIPASCPKCAGNNVKGVGNGLQEFERFLRKRFPGTTVSRMDSDAETFDAQARILLATEFVLRHDVGERDLLVVVTPEAELNVPEYDIEERLYSHIRFLSGRTKETIIETSVPKSALVRDLADGNYRDFLVRTLSERKAYGYPPYASIAYLEIRERDASRLDEKTAVLTNKLRIIANESGKNESDIAFDRSMRKKRSGEWIDTIVLRSDRLDDFIDGMRTEILRNRNVFLEIRGQKLV